jgi:predicted Zn-ribbon and HTH transcriptional regulator
MAVMNIENCPLCGVYVKSKNIGRHINRVHPRFSQETYKILIDPQKCPICGNTNDPLKIKNGLSICDSHYIRDIRPFLIRNFYIKLKDRNNSELAVNPDAAFWAIRSQLSFLFGSLGWEPEEATEAQFLAFGAVSMFTGYLLLRVIEAVPEIGEKLFSHAETDQPNESIGEQPLRFLKVPKKFEQAASRLLILIDAEFELFKGIKLGSTGYYNIAVDDEQFPKNVLIVPNLQSEATKSLLLLLMRDANEQWHGTFRKIVVPSGTSSAHDDFGAKFLFNRSLINEYFSVFKKAWNEALSADTKMSANYFEKLWDWLKWVVSTEGVTENNQTKATHFESYKSFDLDKTFVFDILKEILPEISDCLTKISLRELSKSDPYGLIQLDLAAIARAFKVSTPNGWVYFFTCREWFYNRIMPIFVNFARRLEIAGPSFERDMQELSSFYSKFGVAGGEKSALGLMIEPRLAGHPTGQKTSRSTPWRILGKEVPVELTEDPISKLSGNFGSIDLVVYANMNLYLIELKALNLECGKAIKYMRERAPVQCARYAEWVREKGKFDELLQKHGIREDQLNAVRILVCSSGIFKDLEVKCQETGECFAVVSEFSLFSTMSGIFPLSLKEPFPLGVGTISAALKIINENIQQVNVVDVDKELGQRISRQLIGWTKLITCDRRRKYIGVTVREEETKAVNLFGIGHIINEAYLADTVSWILSKPIFVGEAQQYKFYLGSQVGNVGETIVCGNCKSAIKFYRPDQESDAKAIDSILSSFKCPLCGNEVKELENTAKIRGEMTMLMAKFKYEIGKSFE